MRKKYISLSIFLFIISLLSAENQMIEILVSNITELNSAILSATPGQTIVMKDGRWKNVVIDFKAGGTSLSPVVLRAQNPGKVVLTEKSMLIFSKPNLVVDGLVFRNGTIESGSVITFISDSCRLTNVVIRDYNPSDFQKAYYWVYFQGSYNRMDHCLMTGKNNMNPVVQNHEENSRYNRVDSCIVRDIPYIRKANGREIFRIFGYGHADQTGNDGAYFSVEYNLFEQAHGEGTEIVSLKSNYNSVKYNTVIASKGGLVNRRGKHNIIEGNIILGKGMEKSCGIRIADSGQMVVNNYIENVAEDGIRLMSGEYYEKSLTPNFAPKQKDLPKYLQVKNCYFGNNSVINCGGNGFDIGYNYMSHWPDLQMVLLPENNHFNNNLVSGCKGFSFFEADQTTTTPLNIFKFKPNFYDGNIMWGGDKNIKTTRPDEIKMENPKLKYSSFGLYKTECNKGANSTKDSDNQTLKALHQLTENEVGPKWLIHKN